MWHGQYYRHGFGSLKFMLPLGSFLVPCLVCYDCLGEKTKKKKKKKREYILEMRIYDSFFLNISRAFV